MNEYELEKSIWTEKGFETNGLAHPGQPHQTLRAQKGTEYALAY